MAARTVTHHRAWGASGTTCGTTAKLSTWARDWKLVDCLRCLRYGVEAGEVEPTRRTMVKQRRTVRKLDRSFKRVARTIITMKPATVTMFTQLPLDTYTAIAYGSPNRAESATRPQPGRCGSTTS